MKYLRDPEGAGPHLAARANTVWPERLAAANLVLGHRDTADTRAGGRRS